MRIQKKTKMPKENLNARGIAKIKRAVEFTSKKYNVSKSFVIAVALAEYFGIREQEDYHEPK